MRLFPIRLFKKTGGNDNDINFNAIIAIVAVIVLWGISTQRKLVVLDENISNARGAAVKPFDALTALLDLKQVRSFTTTGTKVVELRYEGKKVAEYTINVIARQ